METTDNNNNHQQENIDEVLIRTCKLPSCNELISSTERKNKVFCCDAHKNKYYNNLNNGVKQTWESILEFYNQITDDQRPPLAIWLQENFYPPKQKSAFKVETVKDEA